MIDYFEPEKYVLDLEIDKKEKTIGGIVKVSGEVKKEVVKFHAVGLEISDVLVDGAKVRFHADGEILEVYELALGKIVSLSSIALLSGISSFIGIALSLPNMIAASDESIDIPFNYTPNDYIALLLVILASVLVMASAVSLLSALAKDVKNAGTMITSFMLVVMLAGLLPMFQTGTADNLAIYLIPFYNAIEVMADVFAHSMRWTPVLITLVSDIAYTGIAVWGLTRMFNSEKVMFSK